MDSIGILANILSLAVGAGLNLYAAVLVTGLGIRYGWFTHLPQGLEVLSHPVVLVAAGAIYLVEFFADKIPFVTPIWDGIHTVIRPVGGAFLALGITSDLDPVVKVLAMLGAGTVALGTHSSKMGIRLMAHSTPEPVSHSILSVLEDISVVALLALAFEYPYIALPILAIILIAIAVLLPSLLRIAKFLLAGVSGRISAWKKREPGGSLPAWLPEHGNAIRAFSRNGTGAPQLKEGYILFSGPMARFVYRSWGRTKSIDVGRPEPGVLWGVVYDVVQCTGASFYVTKDWSSGVTSQTFPSRAFRSEDYI